MYTFKEEEFSYVVIIVFITFEKKSFPIRVMGPSLTVVVFCLR